MSDWYRPAGGARREERRRRQRPPSGRTADRAQGGRTEVGRAGRFGAEQPLAPRRAVRVGHGHGQHQLERRQRALGHELGVPRAPLRENQKRVSGSRQRARASDWSATDLPR